MLETFQDPFRSSSYQDIDEHVTAIIWQKESECRQNSKQGRIWRPSIEQCPDDPWEWRMMTFGESQQDGMQREERQDILSGKIPAESAHSLLR